MFTVTKQTALGASTLRVRHHYQLGCRVSVTNELIYMVAKPKRRYFTFWTLRPIGLMGTTYALLFSAHFFGDHISVEVFSPSLTVSPPQTVNNFKLNTNGRISYTYQDVSNFTDLPHPGACNIL